MGECDAVQLSQLPDEIIEFILTYLPPYQDLQNCKLVSKRWHKIVKDLIRRSKLNLQKSLVDFRLQWQVFSQPTTTTANENGSLQCAPTIAGRFSHSAVRSDNSMYVFGGGSSSDTTFNDLWRFDLSEMRWERPLSMGSYPSPKGSASMVCWKDQLVLFGGWRYPSLYPPYQPWCLFDELHFYDLNQQRWTLHVSMPCPPPMAGHSATVHGNIMVVFGGYQIADGVNSLNNETWALNLTEKFWWQPRIVGSLKPPPRYGQFQVELDETHLLIIGGCGGPNSVFSDAWLLDMSNDDAWIWSTIPIRNKNLGATHMWCNPACKVNSQLVVLGPTPNMPNDFHMIKQTRGPVGGGIAQQRLNINQNNEAPAMGGVIGGVGGVIGNHVNLNQRLNNVDVNIAPQNERNFNRRAILDQHMANANNTLNNNNYNGWNQIGNNLQPRTGRLSDLHGNNAAASPSIEEQNHNRPSTSSSANQNSSTANATRNSNNINNDGNGEINVVSRGQGGQEERNNCNNRPSTSSSSSASLTNSSPPTSTDRQISLRLALRCRENEPFLPKRFDDVSFEDQFRMAAFNTQTRKDHNERIRRMEEKMNALRNSRRNASSIVPEPSSMKLVEPSPKRIKRNVLSLFVCDLSAALSNEPYLQWLEYKNNGIISGAPERLILSTLVPGHGELILFGGVHKETLGEITHQVSNSVHFLSSRRDIV